MQGSSTYLDAGNFLRYMSVFDSLGDPMVTAPLTGVSMNGRFCWGLYNTTHGSPRLRKRIDSQYEQVIGRERKTDTDIVPSRLTGRLGGSSCDTTARYSLLQHFPRLAL